MAKQTKAAIDSEIAALEQEEAAIVPEPTTRDPMTTIGLEAPDGAHTYLPAPEGWEHDRRIIYQGQSYEHTRDDSDGCWIYRAM